MTSEIGQSVLLVVCLVLARYLAKKFLAAFIHSAVRAHKHETAEAEQKREDTLIHILATSLTVLLWIVGIMGILVILDVNVAGLVTGAGVVGLVVGLGGQNAMKDYIAGFFILLENQYRVGDIVTLGDVSGVVERITLRLTQLRDLDGVLHSVPNGSITVVSNLTFDWSNVHMNIGVSYDTDIEKLRRVINETGQDLAQDEAWRPYVLEPIAFLRVDGFGDSAVTIKALGKVAPGKQWEIAGEFRSRLKKAFDKHHIEIPFPQRVIHQPKKP